MRRMAATWRRARGADCVTPCLLPCPLLAAGQPIAPCPDGQALHSASATPPVAGKGLPEGAGSCPCCLPSGTARPVCPGGGSARFLRCCLHRGGGLGLLLQPWYSTIQEEYDDTGGLRRYRRSTTIQEGGALLLLYRRVLLLCHVAAARSRDCQRGSSEGRAIGDPIILTQGREELDSQAHRASSESSCRSRNGPSGGSTSPRQPREVPGRRRECRGRGMGASVHPGGPVPSGLGGTQRARS